jgi:hypothetical protein
MLLCKGCCSGLLCKNCTLTLPDKFHSEYWFAPNSVMPPVLFACCVLFQHGMLLPSSRAGGRSVTLMAVACS